MQLFWWNQAFGKEFEMKRKFTEARIVFALRQAESGTWCL
jgi:hypothetical protein